MLGFIELFRQTDGRDDKLKRVRGDDIFVLLLSITLAAIPVDRTEKL